MLSYNRMFGTGTLLSVIGGGTIQSTESNANSYVGVGIFSDKLAHPAFSTKYPEGENRVARRIFPARWERL